MKEGKVQVIPEFAIRKRSANPMRMEIGRIKYQVLEKSDSIKGWPFTKEWIPSQKKLYKPLEVDLIPLCKCNETTNSYERAIKAFNKHLEKNHINEAQVTFLSETKSPTDIPIMYDKFENYIGKRGWEITLESGNTYHMSKKTPINC